MHTPLGTARRPFEMRKIPRNSECLSILMLFLLLAGISAYKQHQQQNQQHYTTNNADSSLLRDQKVLEYWLLRNKYDGKPEDLLEPELLDDDIDSIDEKETFSNFFNLQIKDLDETDDIQSGIIAEDMDILPEINNDDDEGPCIVDINGCGAGIGQKLSVPYKSTFRPACNKHDVCYDCGTSKQWKRIDCDKALLKDLLKICDRKYRRKTFWRKTKLGFCKSVAKGFYFTVRTFGNQFYSKKKVTRCHHSCVNKKGNPYHLMYNR